MWQSLWNAVVAFLATADGQTLIVTVLSAVGVYAARLLAVLRAKNASAVTQNNYNLALTKALNLVELVAPRLWKRLEPEIQAALVDGRIDRDEMAKMEAVVEEELKTFLSSEGLQQLAKALGYEIPGFIAWITTKVLSFIGVARDWNDGSVPNAVAQVHFKPTPVPETPPDPTAGCG